MGTSKEKCYIGVYLSKEVLFSTDSYRDELRRDTGIVTDRSALVESALIEYVQRRREEAAAPATKGAEDA